MATVTVVTAERTLEIEATSIVEGEINSAGHLILTRHDGTPLDMGAVSGMQMHNGTAYNKVDAFSYVGPTDPGAVPNGSVWYDTNDVAGPFASDIQKGLVELATDAETVAGTDNTRAVTPASLAAVPGNKVQILASNANTEAALPTAYPLGMSLMTLTTGSGWSISSGLGSVMTQRTETDRTVQIAYSSTGGTGAPRSWVRQYHSSNNGGGWTAWSQYSTVFTLTPASFTQTTAFTSYPSGWSRLYYTAANSSAWDFTGKSGEVVTYVDGTDFARQTWTRHVGGTSNSTEEWVRTATSANGWTNWRKTVFEDRPGLPYAIATGTHLMPGGSAANEVVSQAITFPAGRFTATPVITVTAVSTVPGDVVLEVSIGNLSSTGFTIYIKRTNTASTTVHWIAIQS